MSQISYIKYSDIKEARRYDAEYFKPENLKLSKLSSDKNKFTNFKSLGLIVDASAFYPSIEPLYNTGSLPFLRVANVDRQIDYNSSVTIPEEVLKNFKTIKLGRERDIVITKGGSVARLGFIDRESALSRDLIVINSSKLNSFDSKYLYFYLMTDFANGLLLRSSSLTAQPHLTILQVRELPIFFPEKSDFRNLIAQYFDQSIQKQTQSKQLYHEAEKLLLSELGLLDYQIKHKLAFSTTKKEIDEAKRYDSEYFQPKYAEIIERIEKYDGGCDVAGEIVGWKKGVEVGTEAYSETGKDFIRVSDFSVYGISESNRKISNQYFEDLKDSYQPKQGEILFTKDGTIGISSVLDEKVEGILSGAFLRLTLKEKYRNFEKECLSLIFNSLLCKMQVEKLSGGAIIAHLKPSDFETFKIPLIKPEIQKQIAEKIQESHRLRKESKNLLEEAKRKVEEEIEK